MIPSHAPRRTWFRWYVCGLLLFATTVNYMDRQTLANAATRVKDDFHLSHEQYGDLEAWFGYAFAAGSLLFGFIADRASIRILYPLVLLAWSFTGIATGWLHTYAGLLICRTALGFFESGHWPCALNTTQRILPPGERAMGNSILQSGSSFGAILTPVVLWFLLTPTVGSWRFAFQAVGGIGLLWVVLWIAVIRESDLAIKPQNKPGEKLEQGANVSPSRVEEVPEFESSLKPAPQVARVSQSYVRRFAVLAITVVSISICWQMFRAWLPLFLQEGRGYSEKFALGFVSAFYAAAGVGCIIAGWASLALHRRGMSAPMARWVVFGCCALLTALSVSAAFLPRGIPLLIELLLIAAGSLGLFPCYYALSQELTVRHQGKITGFLGLIAWVTTSPIHKYFGRFIDRYHSYNAGIAVIGCFPLLALVIWWFLWDWKNDAVVVAKQAYATT